MLHTAHICVASKLEDLYDPWRCKRKLNSIKEAREQQINPNKLVFTLQYPHRGLEMSRWFQFVSGTLSIDVDYNPHNKYGNPGMLYVSYICFFCYLLLLVYKRHSGASPTFTQGDLVGHDLLRSISFFINVIFKKSN